MFDMSNPQDVPIQYLKGIGPKRAKAFTNLGIYTILGLLYYFPRRYEDRTNLVTISDLEEGKIQTIKVQVLASGQRNSWRRRSFSITQAEVGDETGRVSCVWFNQPYLKEYLKPGKSLILYGKVERYAGRLQMSNPEFEIVSGPSPCEQGLGGEFNVGRLVPVYTLPDGLSQRTFRKIMKTALDEYLPKLNDCLPYDIRSRNGLENLAKSIINIHFPESLDLQKKAYTRLAFEEFFIFQVPLILRKLNRESKLGIAHKVDGRMVEVFIRGLPFKLTIAQERVIQEIKSDMVSLKPMQRLLQGDVGSGKTVVATVAGIMAIQGGYQVAFMAPTEILARQHYDKIKSQAKAIKIGLLTASIDKKDKGKILREIKEGKVDLVIGTHALLEAGVIFKNLGLVVIDEQHKFGVGQRALLPQKGINPDVLIMTATPIPRTLAITLYGDLDISIIRELPPGRGVMKTILFDAAKRQKAYKIAREELTRGNQVYIIYPVIEESLALDISGAKKMYAELKASEFKEFKLGLIHGRLKQEEQDKIMSAFKNKKLDILISTTILEVGIDIPSATCMIVEYAERFGLSQLHQLRGRIGRGSDASCCILISDAKTEEAVFRLGAMVKYSDGFRISEEDLKIRGPGEFFGREQHGLSELKIANPLTQMQLLKRAREEAVKLISADPHLVSRQNQLLKESLLRKFPEYEKLVFSC
ncbi:MAG: DNA helicase RecG [Candidatus Omnitrophica bacterium CG08_land_8_20_14_0_20_41_16]|uniref:ATP-dependent DNA helicase RecG n=1 Tax=Candidatus Sherwoodlollariibacterium unditelluris TaxID=1974757 RepID=A0A2G9YJ79_9BACT|nr:MAG: ATP-dependent DNA helicase RecG [Candidatus Omnitrophica bacterium CG23_combo_of_CG06-09_8_20_14_all_41_10]PIS33694.1 MAG: DNA helicase RecG [Candidatus Omnitrophica bacterium CG08_land_8_20_14_0_20_41_16]